MPTVHVKRTVFPPGIQLTVSNLPPSDWDEPRTGQTMHITTRITDSVVDVEFNVNHYDENDLNPLIVRAWELASVAVNIYSYSSGYGMAVLLDTFVRPDGTETTLLSHHDNLAANCKAFDLTMKQRGVNDLAQLYGLILSDLDLMKALNDLVSAITFPSSIAINCARAVEGIRNLMVSRGMDRKQGWPMMRERLNLDQKYLAFVTDASTAPRHGDRRPLPDGTLLEVLNRSWKIMDRYLEYRKRGSQPLPIAEFHVLAG